tara:strand:- start:1255 stop:2115 length:861 start_codon:yes stop_codon:yes gene_type:complete
MRNISEILKNYSLSNIEDVERIQFSHNRLLWDEKNLNDIVPNNHIYEIKSNLIKYKLSDFHNLKVFDASTLRMEDINDDFFNDSNLEKFEFRNGKIRLQKSFTSLKNLKELNLFDVKISSLPKNIGDLKKLEFIRLSQTNIKKLPDSFSELNNLKSLTIYNKLESLDNIIIPENLIELDCRGNKISFIPDDIFKASKLEVVDFSSNPITKISLIKNNNIKKFSIRDTPIGIYKKNILKLKKLFPNGEVVGGSRYCEDTNGFIYLGHCKKEPNRGQFFEKDFDRFKL